MTYYLAQIYFSLSFQTTTEKRPLVTKSSTAASNQTGSASRNTSAATAASKTTAPVRTAGSARTTTTAARKPLGICVAFFTLGLFIVLINYTTDKGLNIFFLASKTDSKPGEEKKPSAPRTSTGRNHYSVRPY